MPLEFSFTKILDYLVPRKILKMVLVFLGKTPPPWNKEHEGPDWSLWRDCLGVSGFYLEYGAGRSTLYATVNYECVVRSVETDQSWSQYVESKSGHKAQILLVDLGPTGPLGRPLGYTRRDHFLSYCQAGFDGGFSPDLVLIDGRFRVAVFLTALLKTAPKTKILFDDYTNRPKYHVVEEIILPVKTGRRQALFETPESLDIAAVEKLRDSFLMVMD